MKDLALEIFASRLKRLREQWDMNVRELGEAVGTSNATISRYETGKRDPDLNIVYKLAMFFNVSIDYLCGDDNINDINNLTNKYSKLSDERKSDAMKYINYLAEKELEDGRNSHKT